MTEQKEKSMQKKRVGWFIIANAIVWGAVMIGIAFALRGTGLMNKVLPILGGGAGFSVIFLPILLTGKK